MRLSDEFTLTRAYQDDPNLQAIHARYRQGTPDEWDWAQACLDIGYLMGVISRLERTQEPRH